MWVLCLRKKANFHIRYIVKRQFLVKKRSIPWYFYPSATQKSNRRVWNVKFGMIDANLHNSLSTMHPIVAHDVRETRRILSTVIIVKNHWWAAIACIFKPYRKQIYSTQRIERFWIFNLRDSRRQSMDGTWCPADDPAKGGPYARRKKGLR